MIPACNAAPIATASSGLMPLYGAFPASFSTASWTAGTLVEPPTKITLSTSPFFTPASFIACLVGVMVFSISLAIKLSNLALVNVRSKCSGCPSTIVMNGRLIWVCWVPDNSILAFSAASFNLDMAVRSFDKSIPVSFLNSLTNQSITCSSKSSPPSLLFPAVALTSICGCPST